MTVTLSDTNTTETTPTTKAYEVLLILSGALNETALPAAAKEITAVFTKHGAKVTAESIWGRIKMAYPIKHQTHGNYVLWRITIDPQQIAKLGAELRVQESVLRFLLTEQPKNAWPITLPKLTDERREAEAAKRESAKKPEAVDKSKTAAEPAKPAPDDKPRSLDEILEEKI
ncbi:MAG: 30S ribosomal protein S6 [Parcubacteria group bacterium]